MKKIILGNSLLFVMVFAMAMSVLFSVSVAMAADQNVDPDNNTILWGGKAELVEESSQLGNKDPRDIVAATIKIFLGFLGIIAVMIILFGGFTWMTAMGNEEKTEEARKMITAGIIGLLIILSAYGIAIFVTNSLVDITKN